VVALTLRQIAAEISASQGLSKKQAEAVLSETVSRISKGIAKEQRVRFGALGIFSVKKLAARKGRNPATGEAIKIKARKKVAFRAAKELKDAL
jgi:DNA-binding protein HU-beta